MIRFTKEEKVALIFLLGCLFVGIAVMYYKKANPAASAIPASVIPAKAGIHNKININKATIRELINLKHVGPVTAERIVLYREKHGAFAKKEDLKDVKGIGEKTYRRIEEQIVLE